MFRLTIRYSVTPAVCTAILSVTCSCKLSCSKLLAASINNANSIFHQRIAVPTSLRTQFHKEDEFLIRTYSKLILHQGWCLRKACPKWLSQFFLFLLPDQRLYSEGCVLIYTYLSAWRLYLNCRCYQIKLRVNHFYTNRERCKVLPGYLYHWGTVLAVTERIRDIKKINK